MDAVFNSNEIFNLRHRLLGQVDEWAKEYVLQLNRNHDARWDFWYFTAFCSSPVFEIVNWQYLTPVDVSTFSNIRELFERAYVAARATVDNDATREGRSGRRSFRDIVVAGLAVNMLPRLASILHHWGFVLNESLELTRRALSEEEAEILHWRMELE